MPRDTRFPRGQVPNANIEYNANRSRFVYYGLAWAGIFAAICFIWMGFATWIAPQAHAAYVTSPTCDENLLFDGRDHLTKPCTVLNATLFSHDATADDFWFGTVLPSRKIRAFDSKMPVSFEAHILGWYNDVKDQPVRIQVYAEDGSYVVAKIYDPAKKYMHSDKNRPADKGEAGWGLLRLGFIVIGGCIAWIWAGRFMWFRA
jgi:hypothetical protein